MIWPQCPLFIELTLFFPLEAFNLSVNLSHNTNLQTITINNRVDWDTSSSPSLWFHAIISKISSPNLQEIIFSMYWRKSNHIDWSSLDRILSGPRFQNLRSLKFIISTRRVFSTVIARITKKMPGCSERGILVFDNKYSYRTASTS